MDCLFRSNEMKAMQCYIEELRDNQIEPIIYMSGDFDFINSGMLQLINNKFEDTDDFKLDYSSSDYIGKYKGVSVYIFNGLDDGTCCVLPKIKE